MSVHLHIERLVVDGVPIARRDRASLGEAVERELGGLLAAQRAPWPARDVRVRRVGGTGLVATGAPTPRSLGAGIAGAVHAGIGSAVSR